MTSGSYPHARRPDSVPPEVVICVAEFPLPAAARRGEHLLGTLCADDHLTIFDGVLLTWPLQAPEPAWRSLRNLPRLAALPDAVWTNRLIPSLCRGDIDGLHIGRRPDPDRATIVAVLAPAGSDGLSRQLLQAAADVRTAHIAGELYIRLQRNQPLASRP